jgi:hypothetical protein
MEGGFQGRSSNDIEAAPLDSGSRCLSHVIVERLPLASEDVFHIILNVRIVGFRRPVSDDVPLLEEPKYWDAEPFS